ncbi:GumC family protein [Pontibacter sp. CAU 1760]
MENENIKSVLIKLSRNWYYFAISLVVFVSLALFYLKTEEELYLVHATVQLADQNSLDKSTGQSQFFEGVQLLASNGALEDEIGILTSYSTVRQALEALDFTVSYHEYDNEYGKIGEMWAEEIYPPAFDVELIHTTPQLSNMPIHISFEDSMTYRVKFTAEEAWAYDFNTNASVYVPYADVDQKIHVGDTLKLPYLTLSLTLKKGYSLDPGKSHFITIRNNNQLTEHYLNKLSVAPITQNSNIVQLSVAGPSIEKEKEFLSMLTQVYIGNDQLKKSQFGLNTIKFIDNQLDIVSDSLKKVEGTLKSFRSNNQIIDIGTTSQNLTMQLNDLNRKRADLNVQHEYYLHIASYLAKHKDVSDVSAPSSVGIDDKLLNSLLLELQRLYQARNEKQYSSSKLNPVYQVLEGQIKNAEITLRENVDQLIQSSAIALRENQRNIDRITNTMSKLPQNEFELTNINRKFAFSDNIYNYLLQKRTEAGIAVSSYVSNKSVIDNARSSSGSPVSPNRMVVVILAILAGLGLPALIILSRDYFSDTFDDKQDLVKATDLPLVALIPKAPKKTRLAVIDSPLSSLAESFEYAKTNIRFLSREKGHKVIGITSSIEGEGKTFCAINLATTYAKNNRKTLFISSDLRRPTLSNYFKVDNVGLTDYLLGEASLDRIIQATEVDNLFIIAPGHTLISSSHLLEDPKVEELFSKLSASFDQIVVDTPPMSYVSDFLLLQPFFDVKLFVVRAGYSNRKALASSLEVLRINSVENVYMMLNSTKDIGEYGYAYSQRKKKFSLLSSSSDTVGAV